jgi:hypothetical protein
MVPIYTYSIALDLEDICNSLVMLLHLFRYVDCRRWFMIRSYERSHRVFGHQTDHDHLGESCTRALHRPSSPYAEPPPAFYCSKEAQKCGGLCASRNSFCPPSPWSLFASYIRWFALHQVKAMQPIHLMHVTQTVRLCAIIYT